MKDLIEKLFPEWQKQRNMISKGEASWEDFTFEERTCKGWLTPYLIEIDSMFSKRWDYWLRTLYQNELLNEPIPKILFESTADAETLNSLQTCLKRYANRGVGLMDFFDWLLWGFGHSDERPAIDTDVNEFWYRTFNLGLMLRSPHDYLADLLQESKSGYWNNPNAFFATPHHICELMTQMTFDPGETDYRLKTVNDPCIGTGRFLLHASNYSLFLSGNDIDLACVKASTINGFLYMPWVVRPGLKHLLKPKTNNITLPETLPEDISKRPEPMTSKPAVQLTLF